MMKWKLVIENISENSVIDKIQPYQKQYQFTCPGAIGFPQATT